jgi:hypothetical protein
MSLRCLEMTVLLHNRKDRFKVRIKEACRNVIGWCLEKTEAPAKLRTFEFVDPASDETIYLYTSKRYSILCVGERRLYFDRISGKFDGVSSPSNCVSRRMELSD